MMQEIGAISGKVVLVTGATGFIGSHLTRRLLYYGNEVHGVSRRINVNSNVLWWQADLTNGEQTQRVLRAVRPEIVFHLAGEANGSLQRQKIFTTLNGNLITTVNTLNACCDAGVSKVICAGSMEEPASTEAAPGTPYAASKAASVAYQRLFDMQYGLPVVNARIFMTYGPGDMHLSRVIPYAVLSFLRGEAPLLTSGERKVDWVYVSDVVSGIIAAAAAKDLRGVSVDIGTGSTVCLRDVVEEIASITGTRLEAKYGSVPEREGAVQNAANADDTEMRIGWRSVVSLKEGLQRTIEGYRGLAATQMSAQCG